MIYSEERWYIIVPRVMLHCLVRRIGYLKIKFEKRSLSEFSVIVQKYVAQRIIYNLCLCAIGFQDKRSAYNTFIALISDIISLYTQD